MFGVCTSIIPQWPTQVALGVAQCKVGGGTDILHKTLSACLPESVSTCLMVDLHCYDCWPAMAAIEDRLSVIICDWNLFRNLCNFKPLTPKTENKCLHTLGDGISLSILKSCGLAGMMKAIIMMTHIRHILYMYTPSTIS